MQRNKLIKDNINSLSVRLQNAKADLKYAEFHILI